MPDETQLPYHLLAMVDDLTGPEHDEVLNLLNNFPLSDLGNAEGFAYLFSQRVRFDHTTNHWLIFNGAHWHTDVDGAIHRLSADAIRKRFSAACLISDFMKRDKAIRWALQSESVNRRNALLESAKSMLPIATTIDQFDLDPYMLGVKNGVIDLRTGKFQRGRPDQMISKSCGCEFNQDAKCPRWELFLEELFPNNPEIINFVRLAFGYSLTSLISEQLFFLLYGTGANGKSTFLETIKVVLGDYAATTPFSTFEASRFDSDRSTNDLASLKGVRFVTASEVREQSRFNEARLKSLTGGDQISARFLYREYFTYQPAFKIWLCVNHRPKVDDTSPAFWRRIRLIPFERQFLDVERDPQLKEKLLNELPGILNWAIAGCIAWQNNGLPMPKQVRAATEKYKDSNDVVMQFLSDTTLRGESLRVEAGNLYSAYQKWCGRNGESWLSWTMFGRRMSDMGFERGKTSGTRRYQYCGIGLVDDERP